MSSRDLAQDVPWLVLRFSSDRQEPVRSATFRLVDICFVERCRVAAEEKIWLFGLTGGGAVSLYGHGAPFTFQVPSVEPSKAREAAQAECVCGRCGGVVCVGAGAPRG